MNVRKYRIEYFEEEGECDQCGWPIIVGDTAVDVDDGFAFCCGLACARRALGKSAVKSAPALSTSPARPS
jgi:hypothetical protein